MASVLLHSESKNACFQKSFGRPHSCKLRLGPNIAFNWSSRSVLICSPNKKVFLATDETRMEHGRIGIEGSWNSPLRV